MNKQATDKQANKDICPEGVKEWKCPNMKEVNDFSMEREKYKCEKCGRFYRLYYDEMR